MINARLVSKLLAIQLLFTGGCDSFLATEDYDPLPETDLQVAKVAADAPPLTTAELTFWAVRGERREAEIRYVDSEGYDGKCLRFIVPAHALLTDSSGEIVAPGDSVEITIRVADPEQFLFEFQPSGLGFDPVNPARLEIRYSWAAHDINGDGTVDGEDSEYRQHLSIWRQESPGSAWTQIPSVNARDAEEVHAEITGFTKYALASDRRPSPLR